MNREKTALTIMCIATALNALSFVLNIGDMLLR